jgi:micrococcal nuclease
MTLLALLMALAIDGDTFKADGQRIRLWGIDAPERSDIGGTAATIALQGLLDRGVTCQAVDTDRYGRTVAMCFLQDGTDIACALVAMGHAEDWPRYSGGRYGGCE